MTKPKNWASGKKKNIFYKTKIMAQIKEWDTYKTQKLM